MYLICVSKTSETQCPGHCNSKVGKSNLLKFKRYPLLIFKSDWTLNYESDGSCNSMSGALVIQCPELL